MKIFGHAFVSPVVIKKEKVSHHTLYCDEPDLTIRWRKGGVDGSVKVTTYTLELCTPNKKWQFTFMWRHNWCRKAYVPGPGPGSSPHDSLIDENGVVNQAELLRLYKLYWPEM
jgi:hypothetical protein